MEGEIRTDLALEVQERFTEDDVEVKGVVLKEDFCEDGRSFYSYYLFSGDPGCLDGGKYTERKSKDGL